MSSVIYHYNNLSVFYGLSSNSIPFSFSLTNKSKDSNKIHEELFHEMIFKESKMNTENIPLFFIDGVELANHEREYITELLFESYNIPKLTFGYAPILSSLYLYSETACSSEISSLVLDFSLNSIKATPIVNFLLI